MKAEWRNNGTIEFCHEHGRAIGMPLPDNACGIFIHHASVDPDHRRLGLGTKYHKERLDYLKAQGYGFVTCTVNLWNDAELKILMKHGWTCVKVGSWYLCSKDLQEN